MKMRYLTECFFKLNRSNQIVRMSGWSYVSCLLIVSFFMFIPEKVEAQEKKTKEKQRSEKKKTGPKVQSTNAMEIMPSGPKPDWAPTIDPQMQAIIEEMTATEPVPLPELTAFQARNIVLPSKAVKALHKKAGIKPVQPKTDIAHRVLPVGPDEGILVRTYTPMSGAGPFPVIVYYHGGGWVIADLDTYEPSARALAEKANAIVVSVAYRQAPENIFPAAHEDAFAAYKWVVENTDSLGGDPNQIAIAGESAGGNLAVATSLMAKERGVKLPVHIVAVYPIADGDVQSPSYDKYANAKPLSRPVMEWFLDKYQPNWKNEQNPLISLVKADLKGLPPTTIINAEIDPLASEGGDLSEKMKMAGVDVVRQVYPGVTHEFFGMSSVLQEAEQAQDFAAKRLTEAFETTETVKK